MRRRQIFIHASGLRFSSTANPRNTFSETFNRKVKYFWKWPLNPVDQWRILIPIDLTFIHFRMDNIQHFSAIWSQLLGKIKNILAIPKFNISIIPNVRTEIEFNEEPLFIKFFYPVMLPLLIDMRSPPLFRYRCWKKNCLRTQQNLFNKRVW